MAPTQRTWTEDDLLELALAMVPEDGPNQWQEMASLFPQKTQSDVIEYNQALLNGMQTIATDDVQLPVYPSEMPGIAAGRDSGSGNSTSALALASTSASSKGKQLEAATRTEWTWEDDKMFELVLAAVPEDAPNRWETIGSVFLQKTVSDVIEHYQALLNDMRILEFGDVELPDYPGDSGNGNSSSVPASSSSSSKQSAAVRKRGTPWSEDEHRRFLKGLDTYGKGDWRSISRHLVITRTPTQVASHAQKYFLRRTSSRQRIRKRKSIHDITSPDPTLVAASNTNPLPQHMISSANYTLPAQNLAFYPPY